MKKEGNKNMKYIKLFEKKTKDDDELFQALIDENPLSSDHDFYAFIASPEFKENKDGSYRKTLNIENMVRMTKDTYNYTGAMLIRTRFQSDSKLYFIWLPDFLREEVDGKGSNRIEEYLVDIIDKYKVDKPDEQGKRIYQEVVKRRERAKKSGLLETFAPFNSEPIFKIHKKKFVLYIDGGSAAEAYYTVEQPDEFFDERYATLYSIKTDKNFRGKGLSKILMSNIFQYIKDDLNINIITLMVYKDNTVAINLYNKMGFEIFQDFEKEYIMIKRL